MSSGVTLGNVVKAWVIARAFSPSAVGANTTAEQTFSVPGLLPGDYVDVNKPTLQTGLGIVGVRVSAADTLAIAFSNNTAGSITPTAGQTYLINVMRPATATGALGD